MPWTSPHKRPRLLPVHGSMQVLLFKMQGRHHGRSLLCFVSFMTMDDLGMQQEDRLTTKVGLAAGAVHKFTMWRNLKTREWCPLTARQLWVAQRKGRHRQLRR